MLHVQGRPKRAQELYESAALQEPQNNKVLAGQAKADNATEQYERAKARLEELATVDRGLVERYVYLGAGADTTGRTGSADTLQQKVLWRSDGNESRSSIPGPGGSSDLKLLNAFR